MTASRPAPVPVPRALVTVSALVVLTAVGMTFVGAWRTGVAWDETYHVLRMDTFLDRGWFLLENQMDGDQPGAWESQEYVYGPATMTLLHGWGVLWGVDDPGSVSTTADAYAVRHLGVALISLIGLAATAALGRIVLRTWRWGLVTAAILVAVPMWTGHAMFNIKDIPVASGFTLATLGLVVIGRETRGPRRSQLAGPLALGVGITLAIGTRPGIWAGIAAGAAALVVLVTLREWQSSLGETWRAVWWRHAEGLAGLALGAVGLYTVYPDASADPWALLVGSVESSSHYNDGSTGWWYVPLVTLSEFPWLILGLVVLGVVALVRRLARRESRLDPTTTALALVAVQAFALPSLAMARESHLYDGLRQLLFVAPPMAVLAACGLSALMAWDWRTRRLAHSLVPTAACAALVLPVVDQALLFPYNYAYASAGADLTVDALSVDDDRFDDYSLDGLPTDYWRTSVRALAPEIPQGGFVVCSPLKNDDGETLAYSHEGREDCTTDPIGPLAPYNHLRSGSWDHSPTEFLAVVPGGRLPGSNCEEIARITRWRHFRERVMSLVARCELVVEDLPEQPIRFGPGSGSERGQLGGWVEHPTLQGLGIVGDEARLGWALPESLAGALAIDVEATAKPTVLVNGEPRPVRSLGDGHYGLTVPARLAASYGEGRVVLTFSGDPELRLLSMYVGTRR